MSVCLSACLPECLFVCLSVCLSVSDERDQNDARDERKPLRPAFLTVFLIQYQYRFLSNKVSLLSNSSFWKRKDSVTVAGAGALRFSFKKLDQETPTSAIQ
jgi:hypothetical protein